MVIILCLILIVFNIYKDIKISKFLNGLVLQLDNVNDYIKNSPDLDRNELFNILNGVDLSED